MMGTDQQRDLWRSLLQSWGVDFITPDQKFDEIATAYTGPGRFYHTLDHVLAVLSTVESLAPHAKNLNGVKLAAWLHDVIYDSKASDNEDRSAEFAERLCQELSIPEGREVAALIRKTKTHEPVTMLMPRYCSTPILPSWGQAKRSIGLMRTIFGGSTPGCRNRTTGRAGGKSYRPS